MNRRLHGVACFVAFPFYVAAIGAQVVVLAYRMAKLERALQQEARRAAARHVEDMRAEQARMADWSVN